MRKASRWWHRMHFPSATRRPLRATEWRCEHSIPIKCIAPRLLNFSIGFNSMTTTQCDPPLVAILRGLQPEDAVAVGTCLFEAGFRLLEVPLNRSGAIEAIRVLTNIAPSDALVGGGTMLSRA